MEFLYRCSLLIILFMCFSSTIVSETLRNKPTKTLDIKNSSLSIPTKSVLRNEVQSNKSERFDKIKNELGNETLVLTKTLENCAGQHIPDVDCTKYASITESEIKIDENRKVFPNIPPLGSFLPSIPKITLPKLPKKKIVTFTMTVVKQITKYEKIYPSCLQLRNIRSVCDGELITIIPTNSKPTNSIWRTYTKQILDADAVSRIAKSGNLIEPTSATFTVQPTAIFSDYESPEVSKMNIIEPSELDHDFDYIRPRTSAASTIATPTIEQSDSKLINIPHKIKYSFESLLLKEPMYKFVTEYASLIKTQKYTDYAHTATIIAENCIPSSIKLPFCKPSKVKYPPSVPSHLETNEESTFCDKNGSTNFRLGNDSNLREQIQNTVNRVQNVVNSVQNKVKSINDQLSKFIFNNPHGFLGINPENAHGYSYGAVDFSPKSSASETESSLSPGGKLLA